MNAAIALKILDILLLGMTLAPEARAAAQSLADFLRGLDGEDPTAEQWNALNSETDALLAGLSARAAVAAQG